MQARHEVVPVAFPLKERDRLCALARHFILDTPSESGFNTLTALATSYFRVAHCSICLIGEPEHLFISTYGTQVREVPHEETFCNHSLLLDAPLVLLDTNEDSRVAAGLQLQSVCGCSDEKIRFYAGVPLLFKDGQKLGTFSIFDIAAHQEFGEAELDALKNFAFLAAIAIETPLLPRQISRPIEAAPKSFKSEWQILEATTDCVFMLNRDWAFTYLNQRAVGKISQGRNLLGANIWEAFPGALCTPFEDHYRQAVRDNVPVSFEEYYPDLQLLFEVHAYPSEDGLAIFFRDITQQRAKEVGLQEADIRYRLATLSTKEGIWDWNPVTGVAYFSARWQEIVGLPATEITGTMSHWLERSYPKDLHWMDEESCELLLQGASEFQYECRICHEDGSWHWMLNRGMVVRNDSGTIVRITGSISDITEKKCTDPLTGLHNRISLTESIEYRLNSPLINHKTFAVLVICLDLFDRIIDSIGQKGGDAILIEVARRLESTIEGDDLSMIAHTGEDEFIVILERVATVQDALAYANRLQVLLSHPIEYNSQKFTLSASIGLAMGTEGHRSSEKMLEDAVGAMRQAKAAGSAQCVVFSAHMREPTRRRVQIESDLRGAVQDGQLTLHYQPKVVLQTGKIIGFEALVRWLHPARGLILPAEFIPYAEESSLIVEIGTWTLRQALRRLMSWRQAGLVADDVTMSVNLAARQLESRNLLQEIQHVLASEQAPAGCLTLEITEGALIGNMGHATEVLQGLRQAGIGLDLDDFGTGFSSLSYLHRLPFHALKIDRSFVQNLETSQESRAIMQSIIQLGDSMNITVIAEGVETSQQRARLIQLGCLYAQGHFFSRPLPVEVMEKMLQAQNMVTLSPLPLAL